MVLYRYEGREVSVGRDIYAVTLLDVTRWEKGTKRGLSRWHVSHETNYHLVCHAAVVRVLGSLTALDGAKSDSWTQKTPGQSKMNLKAPT